MLYFVGIGSGNPELLTIRAARLIWGADALDVDSTERSHEGPTKRMAGCGCPRVTR